MLWKLGAAGSLLAGLWQFYASSESNRRAVTLLAGLGSGLFNPEQATSELHNLMARESIREPYGSANPQYVAWVVQQIRVKNQGKKIVGLVLCVLAWFLFSRG